MDFSYLLQSFSKFLVFIVFLLNCGDSFATFLPSILYIIGCSLTCYIIHNFYSNYSSRSQGQIKILILVILLYGGLFWMGMVFLAKTAALMMAKQDTEKKIKNPEFKIVRVTVTFCSLVAIFPNVVALYLYLRYRQHLRLMEQFNDLIRSVDENRTEFGTSHQIQELPILDHRPQKYFSKINLRSCPNLSQKLKKQL